MSDPTSHETTQLLLAATAGDAQATQRLMPMVYDAMRRIAQSYFAAEPAAHTLQPTALVHEAYFKLIDQDRTDWQGRTHFLAVGAQAMRRILVDHARAKGRKKRGGRLQRFSFDEALSISTEDGGRVLDLNEALEKLSELDPRQAQIVELKFFGGLTEPEVAEVAEISERTVRNEWRAARAWLRRELGEEREP